MLLQAMQPQNMSAEVPEVQQPPFDPSQAWAQFISSLESGIKSPSNGSRSSSQHHASPEAALLAHLHDQESSVDQNFRSAHPPIPPADHFMEQTQQPHPLPPSFPWQQMDHSYPYQNSYGSQPGFVSETVNYPHSIQPLSIDTDDYTTRRRVSLASAPSPGNSSSPDGQEQDEAERIASSEDKRRRNTAASARFRMKKKQRILNLERSLSDLQGRAKDLEGEAAELRRENNWLKEIVMLKGAAATRRLVQTHGKSYPNDSTQTDDDGNLKEG